MTTFPSFDQIQAYVFTYALKCGRLVVSHVEELLAEVEHVSLSKRYDDLDAMIDDFEPVPESIVQYAEHLNKFKDAITSHQHDDIRQMSITDFEQLFARSQQLPQCYDTIMLTINCSETLFDLHKRLTNTMPIIEQQHDSLTDSISDQSSEVVKDPRLRRSTRLRKTIPTYTEKPVPKRSRQAKFPFKRESSLKYTRGEDFQLIKLFLRLGDNFGAIKKKMNSPRTTDSLRGRWVRLQVSVW